MIEITKESFLKDVRDGDDELIKRFVTGLKTMRKRDIIRGDHTLAEIYDIVKAVRACGGELPLLTPRKSMTKEECFLWRKRACEEMIAEGRLRPKASFNERIDAIQKKIKEGLRTDFRKEMEL